MGRTSDELAIGMNYEEGTAIDVQKIQQILNENKDKDFVKRIIEPDKYPVMNNADGSYSTHLMSWATVGDTPIVYPTIIHQDGKLKKLSQDQAVKHALQTGEFISFSSAKEADWFGKNYKKVWTK